MSSFDCFICFLLAVLLVHVQGVLKVETDSKGFILDGERLLLLSGSVHYPRASAAEWPSIFASMKQQNINVLQTYVLWDIHEKEQGKLQFTNTADPNEDLLVFLRAAKESGLYINLRFGPYVCAEWNYGGIPAWVRDLQNDDGKRITFRTDDNVWLETMLKFIDSALEAVQQAGLLAGPDDGPIIMLQIENEYGNIEEFYGKKGASYVSKLADYVHSKKDLTIPWIMCQQGEGKGVAPPADIINTCNGFYCDDWIDGHVQAFPDQPAMYTELWPGWYQKWSEAVPHRPAADVAYSVMRWIAGGGSFVNYYMAFGGTSFARYVGGPNIITSYDYDVAINEYGQHAEPKYSLLQRMHASVLSQQHVIFATAERPKAINFSNSTSCESRVYTDGKSCAVFLSNTGASQTCLFSDNKIPVEIPTWSVSLLTGSCADGDDKLLEEVFNTKKSINDGPSATKIVPVEIQTSLKIGKSLREKIPSSGRLSTHFSHMTVVQTVVSDSPKEQLDLTHDSTDYIWYSTTVNMDGSSINDEDSTSSEHVNIARREHTNLHFNVGTGAGAMCRLFVNGEPNHSGDKIVPPVEVQLHVEYRYEVRLRTEIINTIDILCTSAGLQNYGPYMERIQTGIVGDVTLGSDILKGWKSSIGLLGEAIDFGGVSTTSEIDPAKRAELIDELEGFHTCSYLCWRQITLTTQANFDKTAAYALDLGSLGKGHIWFNGRDLGRYWTLKARERGDDESCQPCDEVAYTGPYHQTQCQTGCGEPSQRFYKIPTDYITNGENKIIVFEESSGTSSVESIKLVKMVLQAREA
jgi:hypothetical protein